jgi:hypothetical protein
MFKPTAALWLLGALCSAPVLAATNAGFESGTTGWTVSGPGALTGETSITLDYRPDMDYTVTVTPQVGRFFGLLTTTGDLATVASYFGAATTAEETLSVRLLTQDFDTAFNDALTIDFYNAGGVYATHTLDAVGNLPNYPDSRWVNIVVPVGTTGFTFSLSNGGDPFFDPTAMIDYAPAAVPEPGSLALLLGGLGVMGMTWRRAKRA